MHHHRHLCCGRCVARAVATHQPVNHHHANAGYVAELHTFQQSASGGVLGTVHEHEVGCTTDFDQAAVQVANACGVASGKTKHQFGRNIGQAGEQSHHAQHAQRLHT